MGLPAFAEPYELVSFTGRRLEDDDIGKPRAALLLEAASAAVRAQAKADWVDDQNNLEVDVPDAFRLVTLAVAGRVWLNPAGIVQETTGPYSLTNPTQNGTPGIYLTRTERDQIDEAQRSATNAVSPLRTLTTTREDHVLGGGSSYWELSDW